MGRCVSFNTASCLLLTEKSLGQFCQCLGSSKVDSIQVSTLIAALYYNGCDAAVAAADSLLGVATDIICRHLVRILRQGQGAALQAIESGRGRVLDKYVLERIILEMDRVQKTCVVPLLHTRDCLFGQDASDTLEDSLEANNFNRKAAGSIQEELLPQQHRCSCE